MKKKKKIIKTNKNYEKEKKARQNSFISKN